MLRAKLMTIDGLWSVAGSTNFDHRSFAVNDEVNIAVLDRDLAERLENDFANDLKNCVRRTIERAVERSIAVKLELASAVEGRLHCPTLIALGVHHTKGDGMND